MLLMSIEVMISGLEGYVAYSRRMTLMQESITDKETDVRINSVFLVP